MKKLNFNQAISAYSEDEENNLQFFDNLTDLISKVSAEKAPLHTFIKATNDMNDKALSLISNGTCNRLPPFTDGYKNWLANKAKTTPTAPAKITLTVREIANTPETREAYAPGDTIAENLHMSVATRAAKDGREPKIDPQKVIAKINLPENVKITDVQTSSAHITNGEAIINLTCKIGVLNSTNSHKSSGVSSRSQSTERTITERIVFTDNDGNTIDEKSRIHTFYGTVNPDGTTTWNPSEITLAPYATPPQEHLHIEQPANEATITPDSGSIVRYATCIKRFETVNQREVTANFLVKARIADWTFTSDKSPYTETVTISELLDRNTGETTSQINEVLENRARDLVAKETSGKTTPIFNTIQINQEENTANVYVYISPAKEAGSLILPGKNQGESRKITDLYGSEFTRTMDCETADDLPEKEKEIFCQISHEITQKVAEITDTTPLLVSPKNVPLAWDICLNTRHRGTAKDTALRREFTAEQQWPKAVRELYLKAKKRRITPDMTIDDMARKSIGGLAQQLRGNSYDGVAAFLIMDRIWNREEDNSPWAEFSLHTIWCGHN